MLCMMIADRAERKLRAFVKGKGLAFTEPSVPARWHALPVKRCVKEALHVKAQRGGPQALRERASIRINVVCQCRDRLAVSG